MLTLFLPFASLSGQPSGKEIKYLKAHSRSDSLTRQFEVNSIQKTQKKLELIEHGALSMLSGVNSTQKTQKKLELIEHGALSMLS